MQPFSYVRTAYNRRASRVRADKEGLVVANSTKVDENTEIHPGAMGEEVRYASETSAALIPVGTATDTYYDYELRNYVNDINREYVQVLSAYDETGTTREVYTYSNERLTFSDGQDTFTYAYTGLQSVSALTDAQGTVVSNYTYEAWGIYTQAAKNLADTSATYSDSTRNSISSDGNYAATNATAGSLSMAYISGATFNPYSFNAEYTDESTGFIYLRARYYDAVTGTFLTQDSYAGNLLDALSQNRYTYAEDDPVNYIDPSGHRVEIGAGGGKKKTTVSSQKLIEQQRQEQIYLRKANNKTKTTKPAVFTAEEQRREQIAVRNATKYTNALIAAGMADLLEENELCNLINNMAINALVPQIALKVTVDWIIRQATVATIQMIQLGYSAFLVSYGIIDPVGLFKYLTRHGMLDDEIELAIGATKDENGLYHIRQDYWQSKKEIGYNELYDKVLNTAVQYTGGTNRQDRTDIIVNGKHYAVWLWSGDYINLGVGMEAGVYEYAGGGHYYTATDKKFDMEFIMTDKKGEEVLRYHTSEETWWGTVFDPSTNKKPTIAEEYTATTRIYFDPNDEEDVEFWKALGEDEKQKWKTGFREEKLYAERTFNPEI